MRNAGREEAEASGWMCPGRLRVALAAALLLLASPAAAERLVPGGYGQHPAVPAEVFPELAHMAPPALLPRVHAGEPDQDNGLAIGLDQDGAFVTYFTPRLGGFRVGLGRSGAMALTGREQLGVGASYLGRFGAFELGLAGGGGVELHPREPETRASFVVGGILRMPDFGYGPLSARLSYGVESQPSGVAGSQLSLSADLALRPNLAVTGEVAVADEQDRATSTTRGLLGLRLRF